MQRCSLVDKTYRALVGRIATAYVKVRASHGDRAAYALALLALADFLKANGAGGPVLPWLAELGSALTDLDDGIVRPLLATKKRKGLPSNEWRRRTLICLGMRALAERGMDRRDAAASAKRASKVARKLSVRDLVTLYDQFQKKGGIKNREAAAMYANAVQGRPDAQVYFELADLDYL